MHTDQPINVIDITELWESAVLYAEEDPMWSNSPNDQIDWKSYRSQGYSKVRIAGVDYEYTKHGLIENVQTS